MMSTIPFLTRLRGQDVIGMDLGGSGIKLVRIHRQKDGKVESTTGWCYPGALEEVDVPAFREYLRTQKLAGSIVACNIEDSSLKIRRVELPKMPDFDLREAVRWQLRDVVDGPIADYIIRYSLIEEISVGETRKLSLLVYAIRKSKVQKVTDLLKRLTLKPVVVEPTSVSLLALFDHLKGWKTGETYGVIDLGETKSVFSAVSEGRLLFSRPLSGISGRQFREMIEKELGLPTEDAEEIKRALMGQGFSEGRAAQLAAQWKEKACALLPFLHTKIAIEVQKSVDAFTLMFRREKMDSLFLCGGGASLQGVDDYLTKNLAIPTSLLDPREKFDISGTSPCFYNAALGLALYPL